MAQRPVDLDEPLHVAVVLLVDGGGVATGRRLDVGRWPGVGRAKAGRPLGLPLEDLAGPEGSLEGIDATPLDRWIPGGIDGLGDAGGTRLLVHDSLGSRWSSAMTGRIPRSTTVSSILRLATPGGIPCDCIDAEDSGFGGPIPRSVPAGLQAVDPGFRPWSGSPRSRQPLGPTTGLSGSRVTTTLEVTGW